MQSQKGCMAGNKRDESADCVCGLMIIYMIWYHVAQWSHCEYTLLSVVLRPCFYFFMPWFFFKSGMFFRITDLKTAICKGGRLLVPFVIYSVIGTCLFDISIALDGDFNWIHHVLSPFKILLLFGSVQGNLALWFLLTLFVVRCLACVLLCDDGRKNLAVALIFAVLAALLNLCPVRLPLYLANTMSGMFFFTMGSILKEKQYFKRYWVVLVVYVVFMCTPLRSHVDLRKNLVMEGYYGVWMLSSLAGCVLINNIFRCFPVLQLRWLSSVGRDSMNYYVLHWLVLRAVYIVAIQLLHYNDSVPLAIIMSLSCLVLLPLLNRVIKSVEAKVKS